LSYLLDTNVVSETRRRRGEPRVTQWLRSAPQNELFLSVLVPGEIRRGVERLRGRDPAHAEVLERWLELLRRRFVDRILPVDGEVAEEWGRISAGNPIPAADGLMAATAKVHQMTLVTRNVADIAQTGVRLLNPWEHSGV
jgi:predicted nucleic acid-binding protein